MKSQAFHHQFIASQTTSHNITLLLLHGTGGDENDLLDLGMTFGSEVNLLSIRGRIVEHGMPRFFKQTSTGIFDIEDLRFQTTELVSFVQESAKMYGFDSQKMVALGYSNGAVIAGSILLMYPNFLAGAILFRPMIPFLTDEPVNLQTPVFISIGQKDSTSQLEEGRNWAAILKQSGAKVDFQEIDSGHDLTQEDIILSVDWFENTFARSNHR